MYGITETTVHVSHIALDRGTGLRTAAASSPRYSSDLRVHVLDGALSPFRSALRVSLHCGAGLAPRISAAIPADAERFVATRSGPAGGRCTHRRPGALACGRVLEFVGRADAQVKLRGFRIEPARSRRR